MAIVSYQILNPNDNCSRQFQATNCWQLSVKATGLQGSGDYLPKVHSFPTSLWPRVRSELEFQWGLKAVQDWGWSCCWSCFSYIIYASLGSTRLGLGSIWLRCQQGGDVSGRALVSAWFSVRVRIKAEWGALLSFWKLTGGDPLSKGCATTEFACLLRPNPWSYHDILGSIV